MCGIAGYLGRTSNPIVSLNKMAEAINHRGPDNSGNWVDENDGIGRHIIPRGFLFLI